jgi:TMEM175 potassium channel family protein
VDAGHGAAGETDLQGSEVGSRVESTDALDRLIFFADAVFAIAMTLLVLAIPRPQDGTDVRSFLEHQDAGKFIAYLISFWVIALFWLAHHRLFRVVRRYDYGVLLLNLLVLFCIAFLPYPSAILGDHGTDVAATVFYALCVAATGAAFAALSWYVVIHRAFTVPLPRPTARLYVLRVLIVPAVFLLSIPVALAQHPTAAQKLWLLSFIVPALGSLWMRRHGRGS